MTLLTTMSVLDVLKALVSDVRFEMVRILSHGEHCVCDLEAILELPQSKVSYHLAALKDVGLVSSESRGKNSYTVWRGILSTASVATCCGHC